MTHYSPCSLLALVLNSTRASCALIGLADQRFASVPEATFSRREKGLDDSLSLRERAGFLGTRRGEVRVP
jgi:hypothetical protein